MRYVPYFKGCSTAKVLNRLDACVLLDANALIADVVPNQGAHA